jgi:tetratricopeptide (TPR) repeat protein
VWDVRSGEQLLVLRGSNTVEFSPDGERLLCGSNEGVAYLYDSVPWSRRWRAREELAALEPSAREWLREIEPTSASLAEAAGRIRSDSRDPSLRRCALTLILRQVREANGWIEELADQGLLSAEIIEAIRADESRDLWVRKHAETMAASLVDDANELNSRAWAIVAPDAMGTGDPAAGLRLALAAAEMSPSSPEIQDTLAWAYFANGSFDEAIAASERAIELAGEDNKVSYHGYLERLRAMIAERQASSDEAR